MSVERAARSQIDRFLGRVEAHLAERTPEEREEIVRDLEAHIHDALASRTEVATATDVEAVLAEMDPPETYGRAHAVATTGAEQPLSTYTKLMLWFAIGGVLLPILMSILPSIIAKYVPTERVVNVDGEALLLFLGCELIAGAIFMRGRWQYVRRDLPARLAPALAVSSFVLFLMTLILAVMARVFHVQHGGYAEGVAVWLLILTFLLAYPFGRAACAMGGRLEGDPRRFLAKTCPAALSIVLLTGFFCIPVGIFILFARAHDATRLSKVVDAMPEPVLWAGFSLVLGAVAPVLFWLWTRHSTESLRLLFWPVLDRLEPGHAGRFLKVAWAYVVVGIAGVLVMLVIG